MYQSFSDLSHEAQTAIVNTVLGIEVGELSESVRDEIRDWASPANEDEENQLREQELCGSVAGFAT